MYCVPFILEHLIGSSTILLEHLGDVTVTGVFLPVLIKSLKSSGIKCIEIDIGRRPTVLNLARNLYQRTYLVGVHGHVLLLKHGRVYDNGNPNGVDPKDYSMKLWKVDRLFELETTRGGN